MAKYNIGDVFETPDGGGWYQGVFVIVELNSNIKPYVTEGYLESF